MGTITLPQPLPLFGNSVGWGSASISNGTLLDANGEYICVVNALPYEITISHLYIVTNTLVGAPALEMSIQAIDVTTRFPTGLFAAGSKVDITSSYPGNNGAIYALDTPVTVPARTYFGYMFKATTADVSNSMTTRLCGTTCVVPSPVVLSEGFLSYQVTNTSGAPVFTGHATRVLIGGVGTSATDFIWLPGLCPINAEGTTQATGGTAITAVANRFKVPMKCRPFRLTFTNESPGTLDNVTVDIRSDDRSTLITSAPAQALVDMISNYVNSYFPDDAPFLEADTWYRFEFFPNSTNNQVFSALTFQDANLAPAYDQNASLIGDMYTRDGSSVWSSALASTRRTPLSLYAKEFDTGSSGLFTHPGMVGGMRG